MLVRSRSRALLALFLLVAPAAFPGAVGVQEAGAPREIPLYFQANDSDVPAAGLDVFPGDAARGDPRTVSTGRLVRSTAPLAYDVLLREEDAFRVVLPGGTASRPVDGSYVVNLITATGARLRLGEAAIVGSTAGVVTDAPSPPPMPEAVRESVAGGFTAAPAGQAARLVHQECARVDQPHCRQLRGDYGYGALGYCRQPLATFTGPIEGALQTYASRRVCDSSWEEINATAALADATLAGLAPPPPVEEPPAANDWRDVTFDATPPPSLAVAPGRFLVPAGTRLEIMVDLSRMVGLGPSEAQFEFGHPDAPARLVVRADSAGAFAALAATQLIGAGPHSGRFAPGGQPMHAFAFEAEANALLRVTNASGARFTLYTSDGDLVPGMSTLVARPQRFVLGAAGPLSQVEGYAFTVRFSTLEGDGGVVQEGAYSGTLGPEDGNDVFAVNAWREQHVRLRIDFPRDASFRIASDPRAILSSTAGVSHHEVLVQAPWTGVVAFEIVREWGSGPYTLVVDLDERGDLSRFPRLEPILREVWAGDLVPEAGGVEFLSTSNEPAAPMRLLRFDGTSLTTLDTLPLAYRAEFQRVSATSLIYNRAMDGLPLTLKSDDGLAPIANDFQRTIMGADGALYGLQLSSGLLRRVDASLTIEEVAAFTGYPTLVAAPNGVIYGVHTSSFYDSSVDILHVPEGASAIPADRLAGLSAFDIDGNAYVIRNWTFVDRIDAATHARSLVTWSNDVIRDIALAGSTLYAFVSARNGWDLATVPVQTTGFEGFRGSFEPAPTPDLGIVEMVDERGSISASLTAPHLYEAHRLRIAIRNEGTTDAPATQLRLLRVGIVPGSTDLRVTVPPIAAGETHVVELDWMAAPEGGGDYRWYAFADAGDRLAEADEDNNDAITQGTAYVGGMRAACAGLAGLGYDAPGCQLV